MKHYLKKSDLTIGTWIKFIDENGTYGEGVVIEHHPSRFAAIIRRTVGEGWMSLTLSNIHNLPDTTHFWYMNSRNLDKMEYLNLSPTLALSYQVITP